MSKEPLRRRSTPHREVGRRCVVARPGDGDPLLLDPLSTLIWAELAHWRTHADLEAFLAGIYPSIEPGERGATLGRIIDTLVTEGLVER